MSIDNYDWLKEIYKNIDFDKLPHGIIISGSKGLGKRLLANEIATKILSNKLDSNELALIKSNNHPDFFKLDKEKYFSTISLIEKINGMMKRAKEMLMIFYQ